MNKELREYMNMLNTAVKNIDELIEEQKKSMQDFAIKLNEFAMETGGLETETYDDLYELYNISDPDNSVDMLSTDITDDEANYCYETYDHALRMLDRLNDYRDTADAVLEELEVVLTGDNYLGRID